MYRVQMFQSHGMSPNFKLNLLPDDKLYAFYSVPVCGSEYGFSAWSYGVLKWMFSVTRMVWTLCQSVFEINEYNTKKYP